MNHVTKNYCALKRGGLVKKFTRDLRSSKVGKRLNLLEFILVHHSQHTCFGQKPWQEKGERQRQNN